MGPGCCPLARGDQPSHSAGTTWCSGLTQTAQQSSVAAVGSAAVAAVVEEGPPYLGGAGSGGQDVGHWSASVGKYDAERAGAACVGMDWSVVAGTGVWVRAVGISPD